MTGKSYYITTLGEWQRHASRFSNSHWVALDASAAPGRSSAVIDDPDATPGSALGAATRVLVLVEADEGVHLSLEDDPAFEALPHPLAQKPLSNAAQAALAAHGVAPSADMFDAAETMARMHPLLRHRVF